MRKLLFVTGLLVLATACPEVERKVYTFDLKAHTGTLVFENIVTDDPPNANDDFMKVVTQVVKGTKLEQDHTGWSISDKKLYENDGRLDGKATFTFGSTSGAGIYQHDKKAPLIWCTRRDEDEVIVSTNGTRIPELPGCIAWDRKASKLTVTVRSAKLTGEEKSLVDPWRKWSKGDKLPVSEDGSTGLGGKGQELMTRIAKGMTDAITGGSTITVGPAAVKDAGAEDVAAVLGSDEEAKLKICLSKAAHAKQALEETLQIAVQPDGTWNLEVKASTSPDADREKCYHQVFTEATFPKRDAAWTIALPVSVTPPSDASGE